MPFRSVSVPSDGDGSLKGFVGDVSMGMVTISSLAGVFGLGLKELRHPCLNLLPTSECDPEVRKTIK